MRKLIVIVGTAILFIYVISKRGSDPIPAPAETFKPSNPADNDRYQVIEEGAIDSVEQKSWEKTKAGRIQKRHREWTRSECENIAQKLVWIGMTYEMVVYERGKPDIINPSDYGNGIQYQYCWTDYTPSCFYSGADQIITAYN